MVCARMAGAARASVSAGVSPSRTPPKFEMVGDAAREGPRPTRSCSRRHRCPRGGRGDRCPPAARGARPHRSPSRPCRPRARGRSRPRSPRRRRGRPRSGVPRRSTISPPRTRISCGGCGPRAGRGGGDDGSGNGNGDDDDESDGSESCRASHLSALRLGPLRLNVRRSRRPPGPARSPTRVPRRSGRPARRGPPPPRPRRAARAPTVSRSGISRRYHDSANPTSAIGTAQKNTAWIATSSGRRHPGGDGRRERPDRGGGCSGAATSRRGRPPAPRRARARASSASSRAFMMAPNSATPNDPPSDRKNCADEVATPRSRYSTAFWMASSETCITIPTPSPSTAIWSELIQKGVARRHAAQQGHAGHGEGRAGDREDPVAAGAGGQAAPIPPSPRPCPP